MNECEGLTSIQSNHQVDAFAGIGYFTVPALASSRKVKRLFACEWNPDSLHFLRVNIANNVADGDERVSVWWMGGGWNLWIE
jgi:tRNA G37 N-methylase Trm5